METGLVRRPSSRRSYLCSHLVKTVFALIVSKGILVSAQVDVSPSHVTLTEGENATLLCRRGTPIDNCQFQVPGEPKLIYLSDRWSSKVPGYEYFGEGTAAGQCGIAIERVAAKNHGKVKCYLIVKGEEFDGTIDLTVALPPLSPELEVTSRPPRNFFEADEIFQAKCISRDGRPAANISWYLDDQPITQGLSTLDIIETRGDANTTLFTSIQEMQRRLVASDDGKFVVCRSSNPADKGKDNIVKQQLIVKYLPIAQPDITVYGMTLNQAAIISVTIQANPRPRIEWSVSGVVIPQGTQNGRYEAYEPAELGKGEYSVKLSIDSLTAEDVSKVYYLRAANELGQQEYVVRISSNTEAAASSIGITAILIIVIVVVLVVIAVAMVIFAKLSRRWCFRDKSVKSPASETSDTESTEYRSTKFKRLPNFQAIFKKKTSNMQPSGTEGMSSNRNEDEQRLASVAIDSAQGVDGQEPREDKQLVYAELVLKPSDDKPAPSPKDPTEYAEIMHVQKPTKNDHPPSTANK